MVTVEIAVSRISEMWESERSSLLSDVNAVADTLRVHLDASEEKKPDPLVAELVERIEGLERDGAAAASEIARKVPVTVARRQSSQAFAFRRSSRKGASSPVSLRKRARLAAP